MFKRFKWGVRGTALAAGLIVSAACAFFIGSVISEGTHTATAGSGGTGTQSLPMAVSFPANELTPTHAVPLTVEVNNNTGKGAMFKHVTPKITTGAEGCLPAWFEVTVTGNNASQYNEWLAGGEKETYFPPSGVRPLIGDAAAHLELVLKETGTDQSACENSPVTVSLKLS